MQEFLVRQEYFRQGKKQCGAIRAYLSKLTGRSLPQMTRLIRQQTANGEILLVQRYSARGGGSPRATPTPMWDCWPRSTGHTSG